MMTPTLKTAPLRLRRGPLWKTAAVTQFTVARWVAFCNLAGGKSAEIRVLAESAITEETLLAAFGQEELVRLVTGVADILCPGERPGFFLRWGIGRSRKRNRRHIQEALRLSGEVNDWRKLMASLNLSGSVEKGGERRARGGIMADVQVLCRAYPGLDPMRVYHEWPMEGFLDFCDALVGAAEDRAAEQDPLLRDDLEPDPIEGFAGMGGRVVH